MKRKLNWELLPFNIIYAPFIFVWIYYWIKAGRFWFFSNVNPTLYFSGFDGETKEEMFQQIPSELYPPTIYINPKDSTENIISKMKNAGLQFPVAAKPDIGTKGLLFRRIKNAEQLAYYHSLLPFNYVIQKLVTMPLELSIFFVRYPNEKKGKITGLIAKEYVFVKGDGHSMLKHLIEHHPKAYMIAHEQKKKHKNELNNIIAKDEIYYLSELGNHNRGSRFINLQSEIDEDLSYVINQINLCSKQFYYGRYDIKTTSLEDLKQGKNISILEYNGVGSEPNHIYDINLKYKQAIKIIAQHWRYMYEIGRINYKDGIKYVSFFEGVKMFRTSNKHIKLMKHLDLECEI